MKVLQQTGKIIKEKHYGKYKNGVAEQCAGIINKRGVDRVKQSGYATYPGAEEVYQGQE